MPMIRRLHSHTHRARARNATPPPQQKPGGLIPQTLSAAGHPNLCTHQTESANSLGLSLSDSLHRSRPPPPNKKSFTALLDLVRYRREAKESATKVAALSKLLEHEHATIRQVRLPLLVHALAVCWTTLLTPASSHSRTQKKTNE